MLRGGWGLDWTGGVGAWVGTDGVIVVAWTAGGRCSSKAAQHPKSPRHCTPQSQIHNNHRSHYKL